LSLIDIFLTIVYDRYNSMQKRGRKVIPWLYTSFLVSLVLTICLSLIADIIRDIHLKESIFLPIFLALYLFFFFLVKHYYFDSGRNLLLLEKFLKDYSSKRRLYLKVIVLGLCCILPFLFGFIIWLKAN